MQFVTIQFVSRCSARGDAVFGARAAEMDVASERLGALSEGRSRRWRAYRRGTFGRRLRSPKGVFVESFPRGCRVFDVGDAMPRVRLAHLRRVPRRPQPRELPPGLPRVRAVRARVRSFVSVKTRPDLLCCASCHDARFAETCARCRAPLRGSILSALGVKWHADCFRCTICAAPHVSTFVEHDGGAVCKPCHLAHVAERCAGCDEGIDGEFLRALGRKYHRGCFRCVNCRADVSASYLTHDDRPWCRACHVEVHAERCACGCGRGVEGSLVSALGKSTSADTSDAPSVAAPSRTVPSCAWRPARAARRTRPCATRVTPRTTRRSARCALRRWSTAVSPERRITASRCARVRSRAGRGVRRLRPMRSRAMASPRRAPSSSARRTARRASGGGRSSASANPARDRL